MEQGIKFIDKNSMNQRMDQFVTRYKGEQLRLYVTEAIQGKQLNYQR